MTFPTIPTVAAGRVLVTNQTNSSATRTFPSLSSLTKNPGDLLIAIIVTYQSTTNPQFSSWGGGFGEVSDQGTSSTLGIGVATKISTGSETGTFTVTQAATITGDASMILLSIPGAHDSTAIEVSTVATGTGSAADPASFNPSGWDAEDTLWISVVGSGMTSASGTWTATGTNAPANFTDRVDTNASDTSTIGDVEAAVSFRQLNASSLDVGTAGVDTSNARNSAIVIAVRPAPPAVPIELTGTADASASASGSLSITSQFLGSGSASANITGIGGGYLTTGSTSADRAQTTQPATAWSTGTIEFITCVRQANWYLSGFPTYQFSQHRGQMSFAARANNTAPGAMQFRYHDGSVLQTIASNAVLPGSFTADDWVWFRFVIVPGGYTGDYYYSLDPTDTAPGSVSWTQVGTQVSGAALTIRAASSTVTNVGGDSTLTGADPHSANFTYARLSLNGSVVWDADFRDADQGWDSPPATDSSGNSWSFNGAAGWRYLTPQTRLFQRHVPTSSITAVASASAVLTNQGPEVAVELSGSVASVVSASGSLSATSRLAGSTVAVASLSASGSQVHSSIASVSSIASSLADLNQVHRSSSALSAVASISAPALRLVRTLSGSSTSVASLTSALSQTHALTSALSSVASASGSLFEGERLRGSVSAVASVSLSFSQTQLLSGSLSSVASSSASLSQVHSLGSSIPAVASLTGSASQVHALVSAVSAVSGASGSLASSGQHELSSSISAVASSSASIDASVDLVSAMSAVSGSAATLSVTSQLSSSSSAVASLAATLSQSGFNGFQSAVSAVGSASASLTQVHEFMASSGSVASASASLATSGRHNLEPASVSAVVSIGSSLQVVVQLPAQVDAVAVLSGSLTVLVTNRLTADLEAVALVSGSLHLVTYWQGTIVGVAEVPIAVLTSTPPVTFGDVTVSIVGVGGVTLGTTLLNTASVQSTSSSSGTSVIGLGDVELVTSPV